MGEPFFGKVFHEGQHIILTEDTSRCVVQPGSVQFVSVRDVEGTVQKLKRYIKDKSSDPRTAARTKKLQAYEDLLKQYTAYVQSRKKSK